VPRVLKENGYVTGGFGKWHLTPDNVQGAAGPFDHWPQARSLAMASSILVRRPGR
jgi:arylsulfatase A-like enzyme